MSRHDLLYKCCACSAAVLALILVMAIWHLGENSMIACGFTGAFFIHVGARPARRSLYAAIAAGAGFAICYVLCGAHFGGNAIKAVTGVGAFLGLGSLAVMSCETIWGSSQALLAPLRDALVIPVFSLVAGIVMGLLQRSAKPTYDMYLYAFDCSLGIFPGRVIALLFRAAPWLGSAAATIYALLLTFPPLYYAWGLHRGIKTRINLLHSFAIGGICGAVGYQICPGVGPLYWLHSRFPDHLPALNQIDLKLYEGAPPFNAMPSMHMTWALLVWWAAWELTPLARVVASGFVALTILSTIGSGEHYLVDLVVAVPFALAIEGVCACMRGARLEARLPLVAGFGLAGAWIAFLRSSYVAALPPAVGWSAIVATLAVSAWVQMRFRAQLRANPTPALSVSAAAAENRVRLIPEPTPTSAVAGDPLKFRS